MIYLGPQELIGRNYPRRSQLQTFAATIVGRDTEGGTSITCCCPCTFAWVMHGMVGF